MGEEELNLSTKGVTLHVFLRIDNSEILIIHSQYYQKTTLQIILNLAQSIIEGKAIFKIVQIKATLFSSP